MKMARMAVLLGYFGLLGLWIVGTIFSPSAPHAPKALILALATLPLLVPLRGMLYDRRGSFIWLVLLSLLYFIHAVGAVTDTSQRFFGGFEIAFSLSLFGGALARLRIKGIS